MKLQKQLRASRKIVDNLRNAARRCRGSTQIRARLASDSSTASQKDCRRATSPAKRVTASQESAGRDRACHVAGSTASRRRNEYCAPRSLEVPRALVALRVVSL
eukprot:5970770-Pleurochrysis_carterae.AAC.1